MMEARELKAIHGMSGKLRRYYRLPAGADEDLVQSAIVALLRLTNKPPSYRMIVARNAMFGEVQRSFGLTSHSLELGRHTELTSLSDVDAAHDETEAIALRIDQQKLLVMLAGMCQRHRIVLEMRFGLRGADEHHWQEIASKLGIGILTAQSIFDEALEELRIAMRIK